MLVDDALDLVVGLTALDSGTQPFRLRQARARAGACFDAVLDDRHAAVVSEFRSAGDVDRRDQLRVAHRDTALAVRSRFMAPLYRDGSRPGTAREVA